MFNNLPISNALDALVPITRFNRGEANKIFDEVEASGYKIVVKNSVPICVLISPDKYKKLIEPLENTYLLNLAIERELKSEGNAVSSETSCVETGESTEES